MLKYSTRLNSVAMLKKKTKKKHTHTEILRCCQEVKKRKFYIKYNQRKNNTLNCNKKYMKVQP